MVARSEASQQHQPQELIPGGVRVYVFADCGFRGSTQVPVPSELAGDAVYAFIEPHAQYHEANGVETSIIRCELHHNTTGFPSKK